MKCEGSETVPQLTGVRFLVLASNLLRGRLSLIQISHSDDNLGVFVRQNASSFVSDAAARTVTTTTVPV